MSLAADSLLLHHQFRTRKSSSGYEFQWPKNFSKGGEKHESYIAAYQNQRLTLVTCYRINKRNYTFNLLDSDPFGKRKWNWPFKKERPHFDERFIPKYYYFRNSLAGIPTILTPEWLAFSVSGRLTSFCFLRSCSFILNVKRLEFPLDSQHFYQTNHTSGLKIDTRHDPYRLNSTF